MKRTLRLLSFMVGLLLASVGAYAQEEWKELVVNGDFEGSDFSSYSIYNDNDESSQNLTADNIVVDDNDANNHCAKLSFTVSPTNIYFIIKLSEPLSEGNLISFSMRAKTSAAKDLLIRTDEIGKLQVKKGTEWSTCTYDGIVSQELAGCQTITFKFDRNVKKTDIFYFDDISIKVKDGKTPIEFADPKVKEICVTNWDTNHDGELSLGEASLVTNLAQKFMSSEITSFDELQYFTGLISLGSDFYGCSQLTSIIIPKNVTNLTQTSNWNSTFMWCYNLISVTLGDKIESIGDKTFYHCTALKSINIPKNLKTVGKEAFYGCQSLTTLTIPKDLTNIGDNAFVYCSGLTYIVVEEGNPIYDSRNNCNALIETASNSLIIGSNNTIIPNDIKEIKPNALNGRSGLTSLTIPKSVATIGSGAFNGCGGLVSIVVEEGNPNYDSRNNCNALIETATNLLIAGSNNTIIPNDVVAIASYAFSYCADLKSITIPSSVKFIEDYAFLGCSGLTSLTIPNSVTSIGSNAFMYCSGPNLLSIVVEEGNPTYDSRNNCNALIETAKDSLIFGCKNTIIPKDVKAIAHYAFYNCSGMTTITIPNGVKKIEGTTFYECSDLTTLIVGNSVQLFDSFSILNCPIKDFYCYAEQVPDAKGMYGNDAFNFDYSQATLHVPAASIEAYKAEYPWNGFGSIVALTDSDPNPTGIIDISNSIKTDRQYYSLDGKSMPTPQHGLNIIRMSDGTTRKVVVK